MQISPERIWPIIPYSGKFSRVLIFAVFADRRQTSKFITSKNNDPYHTSSIACAYACKAA